MANILNLPVELLDQILVDVQSSDLFAQRSNLLALSVTAKRLCTLTRQHLYRKISIAQDFRLLSLIQTLRRSKTLPKLVVHFELNWGYASKEEIGPIAAPLRVVLPRLVNLIELTVSSALGDFYSIFDLVYLPSLRYFRVFTYTSMAFLRRHPHLQEVTFKEPSDMNTPETANMIEPIFLRLLEGGPKQLLKVCSDGQPRPTLRRIDWAGHAVLPHSDREALHRITSSVTQVNYLEGCSQMSPPLSPPWESVKRVGICVTYAQFFDGGFINQLSQALADAVRSFPNVDTLDLILCGGGDCGVVLEWEVMENVLNVFNATPSLMRVTFDGCNWARLTSTAAFQDSIYEIADDIPDTRVDLHAERFWSPLCYDMLSLDSES